MSNRYLEPVTGDELRTIRESYDLSQEELGERLDLSRSQVANIEAGRKELDRLRTFILRRCAFRNHLLRGLPKLAPRGGDRG
jgi:transcriptional regulator with XRE-family HTH domain